MRKKYFEVNETSFTELFLLYIDKDLQYQNEEFTLSDNEKATWYQLVVIDLDS